MQSRTVQKSVLSSELCFLVIVIVIVLDFLMFCCPKDKPEKWELVLDLLHHTHDYPPSSHKEIPLLLFRDTRTNRSLFFIQAHTSLYAYEYGRNCKSAFHCQK